MKYKNPVIPGFHPDPSICRVGGDYYLVTSSFEYFPGVPIHHSTDLVHWRLIGHCLTTERQLPLEKARASGGVFAPTIRYHEGTFYMTTTNVTSLGNFVVRATDARGPWSDPMPIAQGGIDPSLTFHDGRTYFVSTGSEGPVQSVIDIATGRILDGPRLLWKGTGGQYPEAPHLYRIGEFWYLMLAEGGTEYGHMVTIARSRDPFGPFEPCPRNPILSHRSQSSPIQATGHADLVQASDGSHWMVFLGIRPNGYPPAHHLGRETFLAPVVWSPDGWPSVGNAGRVALELESEALVVAPPSPAGASGLGRDDFDDAELALHYNFVRNPRADDWSLRERPGWLSLACSAVTLNDVDTPAFVGRRQQHFSARFSARLDFEPEADGEEAGLVARMNETHHYEIALARRAGRRAVIVRRTIGSLTAEVASVPTPGGPLCLSIHAERDRYRFSFGTDESTLETVAHGETRYLSTEVAGGFTGVYLGMYATGGGTRRETRAHFDYADYSPLE